TRTYNWNLGWVNAAPDGYTRAFVGINGQWPLPAITANIGDTIKINLVNNLGNETTALHFHGLHQGNTTFEDGAAMVSQCPIAPGQTFVYQFTLKQSGTYWYHAHVGGQYLDGFRGPITIRDNRALANYGRIDGEYTLSLTDLYHVEAPYLVNYFLSANNYNGAEPVPDAALINEGQNAKFDITPGKTYMFHVVNMGALAGQFLQFDQHNMTIIEADGVYTQPYQVSQIFVAVAQRYTVLITAKPSNCQNFAIVSQFLTDMFDSSSTPAGQQATCTAYLVYNSAAPLPTPFTLKVQPWDDTQLVPWDRQPMWDSANVNYVYLTVDFAQNDWGSTRAAVNGLTYIPQKVPTFFSALTAPAAYQMNPQIYGQVNAQVLQYGQVVEVDLNNHDSRAHPFHLHGHEFQIINRAGNEPQWPGLYSTPAAPMRRDVVVVYPGVGVTIRFIANNPGVWLFHCHTEFHVEAGMTATFIEAPDVMVAGNPYVPTSHKSVCDAQGIPRKGNAGGNSKNWLDLSNANTEPSQTYFGALINPPAVNPYTGPS
ncbi:multicopper oxidase-domain-containing protein, partial [Hyaloscypha sp. PMI_1271]